MKDPILSLLAFALNLYFYVLVARIILSFTNEIIQAHPISQFIRKITDPLLHFLHRAIPPQQIGSLQLDIALLILLACYKPT